MFTDKVTYKQRLTTCRACDDYSKGPRLCNHCGCFMPLKAKFKMSVCPSGKW